MLGLALPSFGVEQDYVDRAMLTEEQEKEVIALAQECGIGKVSRISSYNMFRQRTGPGSARHATGNHVRYSHREGV